jgi:hypothetical protein
MDDAHIQKNIDIIYKTLGIYNDVLETPHVKCNEELIIDIKKKIKYEEKNLQKLKDNHPEFFI